TAVKATERGAFEYLPKPFDLRELVSVVERALSAPQSAPAAPDEVEEQLPLIGRSPAMQEIYRAIARLMGTDLTVMITGESGTGKELVARALHDFGKRRSAPFVAINMAAIPRELIESELFGHEKGAFTGASAARISRLWSATSPRLRRRSVCRSRRSMTWRCSACSNIAGREMCASSRTSCGGSLRSTPRRSSVSKSSKPSWSRGRLPRCR